MKSASIWKSMSSACALYFGWPDRGSAGTPSENVLARLRIGMAQAEPGVGEGLGEDLRRSVEAVLRHHLQKGHVHEEVILPRGSFVETPLVHLEGSLDDGAHVFELRGSAKGDAVGLPNPSPLESCPAALRG